MGTTTRTTGLETRVRLEPQVCFIYFMYFILY